MVKSWHTVLGSVCVSARGRPFLYVSVCLRGCVRVWIHDSRSLDSRSLDNWSPDDRSPTIAHYDSRSPVNCSQRHSLTRVDTSIGHRDSCSPDNSPPWQSLTRQSATRESTITHQTIAHRQSLTWSRLPDNHSPDNRSLDNWSPDNRPLKLNQFSFSSKNFRWKINHPRAFPRENKSQEKHHLTLEIGVYWHEYGTGGLQWSQRFI